MIVTSKAEFRTMGEMPMPGGTMSMMWTRMPGQSWAGSATSFLAMWVVMMVAMMLPSLLPTLWRYRECVRRSGFTHVDARTAVAGIGYFAVWSAFGAIVFPLGVAATRLARLEPSLAHIAPIAAAAGVMLAGMMQHSAWKARQLAVCRESPAHALATRIDTAWQHGLRLGVHCVGSCAALTAAGLLVGAMDLRVMAVVTAAITVERLAPSDARVVRAIGDVVVLAGLVLLARAAGFGGQGL
jgi:predicted metal-binding membrane protein